MTFKEKVKKFNTAVHYTLFMKSVKLSQENWRKIQKIKKYGDLKTHNEVVTQLLDRSKSNITEQQIKDVPEFGEVEKIEEASCSGCGKEFKFIIHHPEMYLCCPYCGKTNKITISAEEENQE